MLPAVTLLVAVTALACIAFVWLVGWLIGRRGAAESLEGSVDEDFERAGFHPAGRS